MIVKIGRKLIESKSDKDFFRGGNFYEDDGMELWKGVCW